MTALSAWNSASRLHDGDETTSALARLTFLFFMSTSCTIFGYPGFFPALASAHVSILDCPHLFDIAELSLFRFTLGVLA